MKNKQRIIIAAYLEGKTQREIADEIGISRATVITYLKKYEKARQQLFSEGMITGDPKVLIDKIVEEPKYNTKNRRKRKATDEIITRSACDIL